MKSPKNRDLVMTSYINSLLSPESKIRTLSRAKHSKQGCIRKQVLSPSSGSTWMDSVNREESLSKASRQQRPQNVCFSPTIQHSRIAVEGEIQASKSGIMTKLHELMSMASTHQTHYRKQTSDDINSVYKKIEINQWESQQIEKLKVELENSYERLKEVRRMQKQTEKKTLLLEGEKRNLEGQIGTLKEKCSKKDDIIFGLQQKLATIQYDNDVLHQKMSSLQLQIFAQRNTSIQALKQHLMSFQRAIPLKEISLNTNASNVNLQNNPPHSPTINTSKWKKQNQQLKAQFNLKQLEFQHKQDLLIKDKSDLKQQLEIAALQIQRMKHESPRELKKEKELEDIYLLYIQANSIENLLHQQQKM